MCGLIYTKSPGFLEGIRWLPPHRVFTFFFFYYNRKRYIPLVRAQEHREARVSQDITLYAMHLALSTL